jgi:HEAT repeat protein
MIRQQPEKAVPALIELLQDPDDWVRSMAALGLSCYREQAKSAVPALLQTLTNCSSGFRFFGTNALKAIEPSALTNVGSI